MCRRILTSVLVLFLWFVSSALAPSRPTDEYSRIDSFARNAPDSYARNINTLSDYLTAPARSDMDKVRVIYAWLVSHIRYDVEAANSPYRQKYYSEKEYASRVLQKRKGLCTGYALLFKYMLKRAGVDAVCIRGYARTSDEEAGRPVKIIDHEWNAVKIDGDWYLLDLAWAVSTAADGTYSNDTYFLTSPEQFVSQHFPTDPRWQLLDNPISKADFDLFPKLYASFFTYGFNSFPREGQLRVNQFASLEFETDFAMEYLCTLSRFGQSKAVEVPASVVRGNGVNALTVKIPVRGTSTLRVYARPRTNARRKQYDCIASFTVVNG